MSLQFDKTIPSSCWNYPGDEFPGGETAMTLSFWFYLDSMPSESGLMLTITKYRAGSEGPGDCFTAYFYHDTATPRFLIHNEDDNLAIAIAGDGAGGPMELSLSTWRHFLATAEISGGTLSVQLFIDGVRRDNLAGGTSTTQANSETFGVNNEGIFLGQWIHQSYPFDGRLEDVAIWDRVLSDEEISALYNGRFRANHPAFLGGLKLYWPLDHPHSGIMTDNVENHVPFYESAAQIPAPTEEPIWSAETPGLKYRARSPTPTTSPSPTPTPTPSPSPTPTPSPSPTPTPSPSPTPTPTASPTPTPTASPTPTPTPSPSPTPTPTASPTPTPTASPTPTPTPSAPYDFTSIDPLTQVYKSLWAILEAESDFTDLVKAGNRIKYFDKTQPPKTESLYADTPEVEIIPLPMEMNVPFTNKHSRFTAEYELIIKTGSNRLNHKLFPLEWVITKILFAAADHNFATKATAGGISWDMTYVRIFRIDNTDPTNEDIITTRGKRSWCTRMRLQTTWDIHRAKMNA